MAYGCAPLAEDFTRATLDPDLGAVGIMFDGHLPDAAAHRNMVTLRHLQELTFRRRPFRGDIEDSMGCTQLLEHLLIPSYCIISLDVHPILGHSALAAVASKKNGAGCLGPPQKLTSMHVSKDTVRLWVNGTPDCLRDFDRLCSPCSANNRPMVEIRGLSIHSIDGTSPLPLPDLQSLCLRSTEPHHAFLSGLSGSLDLRELHLHQSLHMGDMLDVLARSNNDFPSNSPETLLPYVRSVTLEAAEWHLHPGTCPIQPFAGGPFSAVIDNFLSARREMGVPVDELHLPHIRLLNVAGDIEWLNRMSATGYLSTFSWSRWRGEDKLQTSKCNLCDENGPF